MRILRIIKGTASDGPGLRNSIYFAGCHHKCPGCHNPESWDMLAGKEMTLDEVLKEVLDPYADVTLTGGDPVLQCEEILGLCKVLKLCRKNIWLFTGYRYEELVEYCPELLKTIDVVVDGRFEIDKREVTKRFAGSTNQRILHLRNGQIEYEE